MARETQEEKILRLMKTLNEPRENIVEMLEADKKIDQGAKLFELDEELEAGAKKARQADRKANSTPRKKKEANSEKQMLIATLENALETIGAECEVLNVEREFLFQFNGTKYKITLACPRS